MGGVVEKRVITLLNVGWGSIRWVAPNPPKEKSFVNIVLRGLIPLEPAVIPPAPPHEPTGRKIVEFTNAVSVLLRKTVLNDDKLRRILLNEERLKNNVLKVDLFGINVLNVEKLYVLGGKLGFAIVAVLNVE